jgi:transcriptional regulator with XRE-family HTH domain
MAQPLTEKSQPQNSDTKLIGMRIAKFRKERGLTQQELAEKIGVKRALLSDYERGKVRIYADILAVIAIALEVTADRLLDIKKKDIPKEQENLKIMKRVKKIETLPISQQKTILRSLDLMIDSALRKKTPE